jgi:hypothetical protein
MQRKTFFALERKNKRPHPPPAAAAPLPPHFFRAKPSCTTKHMVNKSHTCSRLLPSRATETRAKHAALQRCGSRDIDAEYWCVFIAAAADGLRRAEVWGAQAASTGRTAPKLPPRHALHPARYKPAVCAFGDAQVKFSRASRVDCVQRLKGCCARRSESRCVCR